LWRLRLWRLRLWRLLGVALLNSRYLRQRPLAVGELDAALSNNCAGASGNVNPTAHF
jgi:hypothetical protein